jgi:hypothetical protein
MTDRPVPGLWRADYHKQLFAAGLPAEGFWLV